MIMIFIFIIVIMISIVIIIMIVISIVIMIVMGIKSDHDTECYTSEVSWELSFEDNKLWKSPWCTQKQNRADCFPWEAKIR